MRKALWSSCAIAELLLYGAVIIFDTSCDFEVRGHDAESLMAIVRYFCPM